MPDKEEVLTAARSNLCGMFTSRSTKFGLKSKNAVVGVDDDCEGIVYNAEMDCDDVVLEIAVCMDTVLFCAIPEQILLPCHQASLKLRFGEQNRYVDKRCTIPWKHNHSFEPLRNFSNISIGDLYENWFCWFYFCLVLLFASFLNDLLLSVIPKTNKQTQKYPLTIESYWVSVWRDEKRCQLLGVCTCIWLMTIGQY